MGECRRTEDKGNEDSCEIGGGETQSSMMIDLTHLPEEEDEEEIENV